MTQKLVLAAVVIAAVSIVVGFGAGRSSAPTGKEAAIERHGLVAKADYEALQADCHAAAAELANLRAENESLAGERKALAARVAGLEAEKAKEAPVAGLKPSKLPIAFGKVGDLEAIRDADWHEMAGAVASMNALFLELIEAQKKGEELPNNWRSRIMDENNRLLQFAVKIIGSVPTHGSGNGEFTHPLIASNLLAAMLDNAELPLSDQQRAAVQALGNDYEAEYAGLNKQYSADTPKIEKFLDEVELKRDVIGQMRELLSPDQREIASRPELHDRTGIDLFSPLLMAQVAIRPQEVDSAEALRTTMPKTFAERYYLDENQSTKATAIFEDWCQEIEPILEPNEMMHLGLGGNAVLTAARAQLRLVKGLLDMPGLSEQTRAALLNDYSWVMPILKKKGGAPPPPTPEKE